MSTALDGRPQPRSAVPSVGLPVGWQGSARTCQSAFGGFWLANGIPRSPSGITAMSEWPLKLHETGSRSGSNELPSSHTPRLALEIACGVDQVKPWSVDIEPKIRDEQYWSCPGPQVRSK